MDYPTNPPFVRIVAPRLQFLTGNVTFGGTFCNDVLTQDNWFPAVQMRALLQELRRSLVEAGAVVDKRNFAQIESFAEPLVYQREEGLASLNALARVTSNKHATRSHFRERFWVHSSGYLEENLGHPPYMRAFERGNRIYFPPSALEHLLRADPDLDFPLHFVMRTTEERPGMRQEQESLVLSLEFTAPEGIVVIPRWLQATLNLQEGDRSSPAAVLSPP